MTDKDVSVVPEPDVPETDVCESNNLENGKLGFGDGDPTLATLLSTLVARPRWRHESLLTCLTVFMYEMGFHLKNGPVNRKSSFDAQVMRELKATHYLPTDDDGDGTHRLDFCSSLTDRCLKMVLVPVNSVAVVDLLVSDVSLYSLAFDCAAFSTIDGTIFVENLDELSLSFKSKVFELLTNFIHDPTAHPASILRLPVELLVKISCYLSVADFVKLTMCSNKLYSLSEDEVIWRELAKLYLPARNQRGTFKEFCKYQYKLNVKSTYQPYVDYFFEFPPSVRGSPFPLFFQDYHYDLC